MNNVIICPACGFSFDIEIKPRLSKIICPMCGYEFKFPNFLPHKSKEFDNKYI